MLLTLLNQALLLLCHLDDDLRSGYHFICTAVQDLDLRKPHSPPGDISLSRDPSAWPLARNFQSFPFGDFCCSAPGCTGMTLRLLVALAKCTLLY